MTARGQMLAFAAATIAIGCVAVLLASARPGRPPPAADPATVARTGPVVRGDSTPTGRRPAAPSPRVKAEAEDRAKADALTPPGAVSAARRFAGALLAAEAGDGKAAVRSQLTRSATQALAHQLLGTPPRMPAAASRPRRGRLLSADPLPLRSGRGQVALAIRRDGRVTGLVAELEPGGGRWRVADLH